MLSSCKINSPARGSRSCLRRCQSWDWRGRGRVLAPCSTRPRCRARWRLKNNISLVVRAEEAGNAFSSVTRLDDFLSSWWNFFLQKQAKHWLTFWASMKTPLFLSKTFKWRHFLMPTVSFIGTFWVTLKDVLLKLK